MSQIVKAPRSDPAGRVFGQPDLLDLVLLSFRVYVHAPGDCEELLSNGKWVSAPGGYEVAGDGVAPSHGHPDVLSRIVASVASRFMKAACAEPSLLLRAASFSELVARERFGGRKIEMSKKPSLWSKRRRVATELRLATARGDTDLKALFARAGVSRATGYRILAFKGTTKP